MQPASNEHRGNTVTLPKLAVITSSSEPPKNFVYNGESFVATAPSHPKSIASFYNEVLYEIIDQYDVFAFLEKEDDFTFLESCNIIVDKLFQNDMVGSIYSDCISVSGNASFAGFSPTFSHDNYTNNNRIFHQPIFVKRNALKSMAEQLSKLDCFLGQTTQYFDSRLKKLCFHGIVSMLSNQWVVSHIAEPLFTCQHKDFQTEETDGDLSLLFNK